VNPPHKEKHSEIVKKQYNEVMSGLYSYFIRGANIRVTPEIMNEIKKYAVKVVETKQSILVVGRNWIVIGKRICGNEQEGIEIRCSKDECTPCEEITSQDVEYVDGVIEDVEVNCNEQEIEIHDTAYYMCSISYRYCFYSVTIAITIDPHDVCKLNNDKELQLLLDLIPSELLLVRPM